MRMALLIKAVLTPGLIALATFFARRGGPGVGGAIVGLPLTSTPVSVFLALEQGPAFASDAAGGTLLGLLGQAALCLTYSRAARRWAWPASAGAGIGAFLAAAAALSRLSLPLAMAFPLVGSLLVLSGLAIPAGTVRLAPPRTPQWDLAARMLVATAVVVGLTALAPRLGPTWTGLLSPFPVFALVLGAFTHRAQGSDAAARLLRGVTLGSLAHATMFAIVAAMLVRWGLWWTYGVGTAAALAVNAVALATVRQPAAGRPLR